MKAQYVRAMNVLHWLCMVVAGLCLVAITLMIPWGVFTRYILNSASSWPEPAAVLLMVWFSFLSAAICYREHLHIGVAVLPMMLDGKARILCGMLIEVCMMIAALFMFWWGIKLVNATWHQVLADFPWYSTGAAYLPVPIAGLVTTLFVIERFWTGDFFDDDRYEAVDAPTAE